MTSDNDKKAAEEYATGYGHGTTLSKRMLKDIKDGVAFEQEQAFLRGCEHKQKYFIEWLQTKNPMLGDLSPIDLIKLGKEEALFSFIKEQEK